MPDIDWLVIGYGNDLRGDDGAGRRVAEAVEAWGAVGINVVSAVQLTIDLAETLSLASNAVFVDAYPSGDGDTCQKVALKPAELFTAGTHISNPEELLYLARHLYGRVPNCWLVCVPAVDFDYGEQLSATAAKGVSEAELIVKNLVSSSEAVENA